MAHALTIELSEDVYRSLEARAVQQGKTPDVLAAEWITSRLRCEGEDPLLKWAGAIDSEITDVAERHDYYLGEALAKELRGDTDE